MGIFIDGHHVDETLLAKAKEQANKESGRDIATLSMLYNPKDQELYCIIDASDEKTIQRYHAELGLDCDFVTPVEHIHTKAVQNAERLKAIGELSARLAHDLRNPLSVIKNTVEIMEHKQRLSIEDRIVYFGRLHRAIDRISHQIEDVLDFVRPINLTLQNNLVNEIIASAIEKITVPDLVKINTPANYVHAVCDFTRMEVAINNLLMNAIQAMNNAGQVDVILTENQKQAVIQIKDRGCGIPQEIMPNIFEPLFTTKQEGTGLGLASCKKIIEQHGGTIEVSSVVGKGTTFTITLPKQSIHLEKQINENSEVAA
ncbi:sensor histidine kinase [Candidatus Nitrosotenuis uzonensis]|uniref:Histidine kinase n=1 Tax=Candidatus Nitrosotenuis uzonensis TaxID=1407055 RepID=V6AUJ9_9ARCH|nr:ATP-binding protein [Candidatus Nitrosotenuis uzonensis]CDI06202.1 putative Histidine kinase [Candidatus Nitrosotenuis uzonensis]